MRSQGKEMKLECDENGDFVLDPAVLTEKLGVDPERLRRGMRLGLVTSKVEVGTGSDDGTWRLTVRSGNTVWRAIIDSDHEVVAEEAFRLESTPPAAYSVPERVI